MTKYLIHIVDMSTELQDKCKALITDAFDKHLNEKDIADDIRKKIQKEHEPSWNCIVGKHFGAHVVHQTNCYLFCSYGELSILLWKSG